MNKLYTLLFSLIFIFGCSQNEFLDNSIDNTFAEFQSPTITQTLSYTDKEPYILHLPYQIFGNNLTKNDTIIIRAIKSYFIKDSEYFYDSIRIITPQTIFDTVDISIQSNKIWEGGTFYIPFELISKNGKIKISQNYKSCNLYFTRESFINYFSGTYTCFESSTNSTYETIFKYLNDSTINNINFWDFANESEVVPYIFKKDLSKTITIPRTQWIDKLGNEYTIYGNGTYELTGNFEVDYFMEDSQGQLYESGKHIFSKK